MSRRSPLRVAIELIPLDVRDRARPPWTRLRNRVKRRRTLADRKVNAIINHRVIAHDDRRERLLRTWETRVRLVGHTPGGERELSREAIRLARRLDRREQTEAARRVYVAAEAALTDPELRLRVTVQRLAMDLRHGQVAPDIWDRIRDLLAYADDLLDRGDVESAATRLQEAFNLAFNRTKHFEDIASPLASDPDEFLAPFRASRTYELSTRPTERAPRERLRVEGRPHRLLFTTFLNWNFLGSIIEDYQTTPGVEVRTLDLQDLPDGPWRAQPVDILRTRLHQARGDGALTPPPEIREAFDWADTVFVEWGHRALPWVSMLPDLRAKVVARLHSYEAFTPMPHHTDWAGIDDMVFVSPHIRSLVEHCVPHMAEHARIHTVPNHNVLATYRRPKRAGAERTLGLIGWNNITKDPLWAVDVLERLRATDSSWRLRLVGDGFARGRRTGLTKAYVARLCEKFEELGDAIELPGYTEDVPDALRDIGVILSSSRREGTHEGLIQGTASGSFPVVRNWPYVAKWGGAHTLYPEEWIVESAEEAAARILRGADSSAAHGSDTPFAEWVLTHYDWSVVRPQFDALLLDR
ncbi:MAG: hypothetical protein WCA30_06180 [Dermatophilaceae bacterium]